MTDPSISNLNDAIFIDPDGVGEIPVILLNDIVIHDSCAMYVEDAVYVSLEKVTRWILPEAEITKHRNYTEVVAEGLYMTVYPGYVYLTANDRCLYIPHGIFEQDEETMVPIFTLAQALGTEAFLNEENGYVYMVPGIGALTPADEYYNETDMYYLSRIIYCESGNQSLEGKIAVGNVVLNRVTSPEFPNSICDVLFQRGQFYSENDPLLHRTPNRDSIIAAKLCLEGAQVLPTALWFNRTTTNSWASKNRPYVTTIGDHDFYA